MRLRTLLISLVALLALVPLGCSRTTPTEAAAIAAARNDHTAYTLPPEKLVKARHIARFYDSMYFAGAGWGILSLWLVLELGIAARLRDAATRMNARRWVQGFAFLLGFLLLRTLLSLPLSVAAHHASLNFGFSIQSWGSWAADQAKSLLLTFALGAPFVLLVFFLIRRFPRRWWLWLWFWTIVFVLFGVYLAPLVVDPLFNKFVPLSQSNPELVEQLQRVAAHGGLVIPPQRMFLMKASAKTTLMNAYVTGFGSSKRLVIWDTLLAKATPDEILIIVGHEMGHYVLGHIVRGMLESFAGILLAFWVGFHLFQWLLACYGSRWRIPTQQDWSALVLMLLVAHIILFFAEPLGNAFSRGMEHDADVFGQEVVHGIVSDPQATGQASEDMLGEAYFAEPDPSPLVEWWTDSHPSTSFRAAFSKHYDPWAPGAEPKFLKK
jgi:STE24 endopeptidase